MCSPERIRTAATAWIGVDQRLLALKPSIHWPTCAGDVSFHAQFSNLVCTRCVPADQLCLALVVRVSAHAPCGHLRPSA